MGVLSPTAPFSADVNLLAQLALGLALLVGAMLARRRRYRAHKYCQATVLLVNLPLIAGIMVPSFRHQVQPQLPGRLADGFYAVATVHAALGALAEVLGLYIVLVAGTTLLPHRLRFRRYKRWMRTELVLWWVVVLAGVGVYAVWYVAPAASTRQTAPASGRSGLSVTRVHVPLPPTTRTLPAGTPVRWLDTPVTLSRDSPRRRCAAHAPVDRSHPCTGPVAAASTSGGGGSQWSAAPEASPMTEPSDDNRRTNAKVRASLVTKHREDQSSSSKAGDTGHARRSPATSDEHGSHHSRYRATRARSFHGVR